MTLQAAIFLGAIVYIILVIIAVQVQHKHSIKNKPPLPSFVQAKKKRLFTKRSRK